MSNVDLYKSALSNLSDAVVITDTHGSFTYVCPSISNIFKYSAAEIVAMEKIDNLIDGIDYDLQELNSHTEARSLEVFTVDKKGSEQILLTNVKGISIDEVGHILYSFRDITDYKKLQISLQESELKLKTEKAKNEEFNIALNVLMQKSRQDKKEFSEHIYSNLLTLVEPCINKLKNSQLDNRQKKYVDLLDNYIKDVASPLMQLSMDLKFKLTPTEVQVAHLVKRGLSSKEIACQMNSSPRTIEKHRRNIRKKCGLTNSGSNLQTLLSTAN